MAYRVRAGAQAEARKLSAAEQAEKEKISLQEVK